MNFSSGSMMQDNASCGGFDLQGPTRIPHHQQSLEPQHHPGQGSAPAPIHDTFPLTIGASPIIEKNNKSDKGKSPNDEDEPIFLEDLPDTCDDPSNGKKASPWHRVKWTDAMVKLLITAISYINEEAAAEDGRRKCMTIQKKGKWKSVSKVMAERGHVVSPQQCEDKFNDLNKRYKRLNEILGRGTSCEVVENPALLDVMDHISDKTKEEVRKILSSKHLHYEEMCSYHNGNRLHLPPDPELQHSLRLALRNKDDHDENDAKKHPHDDHDGESDGCDVSEENEMVRGDCRAHGFPGPAAKKAKQAQSGEDFCFTSSFNSLDCNKSFSFAAEGSKTNVIHKQMLDKKNHDLEEQRLQIEAEMLELEKERFKWQRFCWKKDRELEMRRMEIERMKLENERMVLELRRKEIALETVNTPT